MKTVHNSTLKIKQKKCENNHEFALQTIASPV